MLFSEFQYVYIELNAPISFIGVDVQVVLREFYERHYLPSAMKLVVVGPQTLSELEAAVTAAVSDWVATKPAQVSSNY